MSPHARTGPGPGATSRKSKARAAWPRPSRPACPRLRIEEAAARRQAAHRFRQEDHHRRQQVPARNEADKLDMLRSGQHRGARIAGQALPPSRPGATRPRSDSALAALTAAARKRRRETCWHWPSTRRGRAPRWAKSPRARKSVRPPPGGHPLHVRRLSSPRYGASSEIEKVRATGGRICRARKAAGRAS